MKNRKNNFKNIIRERIFFLLAIVFSFFFSLSQNAVQVYNINNSLLPNNNVVCIAVDPLTNNKWVGTDNGVAVFDGTSWVIYSTSNSPLTDNYIKTIYIDKQNNKWIGTVSGGVFKFDGSTWTNINSAMGLASDNVRAVAIDSVGIMWFGTSNGLCKYDGSTWTYFNVSNTNLYSDNITSVKILKNNVKVFGTLNGGMAYWNDTTLSIYDHWTLTLPENTVLDVEPDTAQNVWVCMPSAGVSTHYGGITWNWMSTSNSFIPTNALVDCFVEKSTDKKYFATQDAGMLEYLSGGNFLQYDAATIGLPQNFLNCLTQDTNGVFWIGTADSGLVSFNKQQWIGIQENKNNFFLSTFPNPAVDELNISSAEEFDCIELFDLAAKRVFSEKTEQTKNYKLKIDKFEAGCYFLSVSSGKKIARRKIIISER